MSILLAITLFLAPPPPTAPAATPPTVAPAPKATLADLAWVAGRWKGETTKGTTIEETWSEANGESMLGSFRMVDKKGTVVFYEIIVLQEGPSGPVMRIRHFDRDLIALEEKAAPMVFALVSRTKTTATFERTAEGAAERIVYSLDVDTLVIRLEKAAEDRLAREFQFRRSR